jgi:hypothetical protein
MRKYGCLQAIIKSFYSADLYRDAAQNWGGGVLLYLLLVLTICWALLSITIQKAVNIQYSTFSGQYFPQLPNMALKEGELKTPENKPYFIVDSHNNVVAIIDTSGQYKNLDKNPAEVLITKNAVIYKDKSSENKSHQFSSDLTLDIKPAAIKSHLEVAVNWLWVILFPILLLFSFLYRLIQAALYAVIGELFAMLSNVSLTYGQVFRITIFAITPAIFVGTVLDWFSITFSHLWLTCFAISMGYLVFGIRSNKQKE